MNDNLDVNKTVRYWHDGALYDLDTVKSLMATSRYPHALFFAHLVLEKLLKAIFVKTHAEHAPFTHSLVLLAEKSGIDFPDEMLARLSEFTQFNIEGRYPEDKEAFYRKATRDYAAKKLGELEETIEWFETILQKS